MKKIKLLSFLGGLLFCILPLGSVHAADLIVDATEIEMSGKHWYDSVQVINGGIIRVTNFDNGTDKENKGNLQIVATSIYVDSTSYIIATGAGYQAELCENGKGPTSDGGGRGGCAVRDSGGGGAHFGAGGRGTKDCPMSGCVFPGDWEENCGSYPGTGTTCTTFSGCRNGDGLPTVAGQAYTHSIYEVEFGSSGGDAGCQDGDGFNAPQCIVGGAGGGRIVLAAVSSTGNGTLVIEGQILADGKRGCGIKNDSGGGGGGGSVLLVGDQVSIDASAVVSAAGGLGGNTQPYPAGECPPCAQSSGTCDDCGGGGGGGIISVLSGQAAIIDSGAEFRVGGSPGGVCSCAGEAGGGAGELQLNGVYVGEVCDGYDNDFDGVVDNNMQDESCGTGICSVTVPACTAGIPNDCVPVANPSCQASVSDTRPRFMVIVDTSGSMLEDLAGSWTFGDGSENHLGIDTNIDGVVGNDSRLYKAKKALVNVISAYSPDIDFGMSRFAQGTGTDVNCQLAKSFECADICCTYDNPQNNVVEGTAACTVTTGSGTTLQTWSVYPESPTSDACINYAGSCGSPRRGADVLVGFEKPVNQHLMWLDNKESNFKSNNEEGNFCDFAGGGDCELRGTGPTPLADSLLGVKAYMDKVIAEDIIAGCRKYAVILLTDGSESCMGDPVSAAAELLSTSGLETYVIGFSVLGSEQASLNAIANAGSLSGTRNAFFVGNEDELSAALAGIVADSVVFEVCNNIDDDCDGDVDEDFPSKGQPCDDGGIGVCKGTGTFQCRSDFTGVECVIDTVGATPTTEICDGIDNNCNGQVDEGLNCQTECVPSGAEVCDGFDNDCNGAIDETDPMLNLACGEGEGVCEPGRWICVSGSLVCLGGVEASDEMCNGVDDDCNGEIDDNAPCPDNYWCIQGGCRIACAEGEFPCGGGDVCTEFELTDETVNVCMPTACSSCNPGEMCVDGVCVDPCADVECESNETCIYGVCRDCHTLGCDDGLICYDGECITDPCESVSCESDEYCGNGNCIPLCYDELCPGGKLCDVNGKCVTDPCADVSCKTNEYCNQGVCETNPCPGVYCDPGLICIPPGNCVADPCALLSCPSGSYCEANSLGEARCKSSKVPEPPEKITSVGGGNGCSCNTGSHKTASFPLVLLLLLTGAVFFRRGGMV